MEWLLPVRGWTGRQKLQECHIDRITFGQCQEDQDDMNDMSFREKAEIRGKGDECHKTVDGYMITY